MFVLDTVVGRVRIAFTDRHGGVSTGPWATLNLSPDSGDDLDAVATNLTRLARSFGVSASDVLTLRQVHGADVAVVDRAASARPAPDADALVTATAGPVLLARVADCVPVALADPVRGLAGVVHSGRRGTLAGVVPATVDALRAEGAEELQAWIGPRVCGACYEVPAQLRAELAAVEPATWATTRAGSPALDLAAGVRDQLHRGGGVLVHDLAAERPVCTLETADLFSARRQGERSGRLGVLAQVQP